MMKQNMPNIPGMEAMTDTLDFVKNLWSNMGIPGVGNMQAMNIPGMPGMNIPGMVMPTLSVDEINKKVSDLKAVESWLTLNMNMLRGTIQALEVQAATISTLQTMGESFTASMSAMTQPADKSATAPSSSAGSPSNGAAGNGSAGSNATNGAGAANGMHGKQDGAIDHTSAEPSSKDESDAAALTAPLVNAAAWWNMLQDQFKQAVSTAMTETQTATQAATKAVTKAAAPAAKPKAKPKAKSASGSTSSSSSSSSSAARKRKTSK